MSSKTHSYVAEDQSLTDRVLSGILWLFAGTGAQMFFRTLVMIILSRLLAPVDFGVAAAALVVINFIDTVSQVGIGPAVTQRPNLSDVHIRVAFSFSIFIGVGLFLSSPAYVPSVARLFNIGELQRILLVAAAVFPMRSIGLVAESLMIRELRFNLITRIDILSYVLGYGLIGVVFSYMGYGSWALVYAVLGQVVLRSVLLLYFQPHPKGIMFDRDAFGELLSFGGGFTLARIANSLAVQGDNFVIGRWLGPAALGLYGRAYQLMVTPATLFGTVLDKVLFPAMAKVQDDRSRLAESYRRGVAAVAIMVLPASVMIYSVAPEIVVILLGDAWDGVIAPFRILVIGTLFRTSYKISDSIARATGAVYKRAWRQVVYAIAVTTGAILGLPWGLSGVSVGITTALTTNFLLMAHLSLKLTGIGWRQFIQVHMPSAKGAVVLSLVVLPVTHQLRVSGLSDLGVLVTSVVLGLCTSLGIVIWRPKTFLGPDGMWMVRTLARFMPSGIRKIALKRLP